jgi:hypothetical protein
MSILFKKDALSTKAAYNAIKKELDANGFKEASKDRLLDCAKQYGRENSGPSWDEFSVMNRGLGNKKSNYFVFLGIKKKLLRRDELQVLYYNPEPPDVKFNFRDGDNSIPAKETRKDIIVTRAYNGTAPIDPFIVDTVSHINEMSSRKPENRYYLWPHNHIGYVYYGGKPRRLIDLKKDEIMGERGPLDDGKSNPFDMMMSAALFGGDFFALTSHNNFSETVYRAVDSIGSALGMTIVPGIEFTMPLYGYNPEDVSIILTDMETKLSRAVTVDIKPNMNVEITRNLTDMQQVKINVESNSFSAYDWHSVETLIHWYNDNYGTELRPIRVLNGPHVVAMFRHPQMAIETHAAMLLNKDVLFPPLSAPGIDLFGTTSKLKTKYEKSVFIMVAHPFCELGLPSVGVGNRMTSGDMEWARSISLFEQGFADAVAAYNPSVNDETHRFSFDGKHIVACSSGIMPLISQWVAKRAERAAESSKFVGEAAVGKWGFQTALSNPLSIAYAHYVRRNLLTRGILKMGEPDTHWYGDFSLDEPEMNHLGRTVTFIEGAVEKSLDGLFAALNKAKENRDNEPGDGKVAVNYYAYCQMNPTTGAMDYEPARAPTKHETMDESWKWFTNYGASLFNVILPDFFKRTLVRSELPLSKAKYVYRKFLKE